MLEEEVVLSVAGEPLPHKSCTLSASAEEAVRKAMFDVAWIEPGLPCQPGDEAIITVSGDLWGTGYVDINPSHGETDRRYQVEFQSRTIDAVETSIEHPTGLKRDADLIGIAKEFDTLGIGIEGSPQTFIKPIHKTIPGESLFDTIAADARAQGVLIHDNEQGRLVLADKPEGRHAGGLELGVNIKTGNARLTDAGSYSTIAVRGQASEGVTSSVLRPEARVAGTSKRRRPLIIMHEGEVTSDRLKRRAEWEARRGAGNNTSATIVTPGWRDQGGKLWQPNFLVSVDDSDLGIKQDMVIASVSFSEGDEGTIATLSLKDPRAFGGENPRGESAQAWTSPAAEPEYLEG